jgi:hypothetical protein
MKTHICNGCGQERTYAEFRDLDVSVGRLPNFCRFCRESDPEKEAYQEGNRLKRDERVYYQRGLGVRTAEEVRLATEERHPSGFKTCPNSSARAMGCGRTLPVEEFGVDRYQRDGLNTHCPDCR